MENNANQQPLNPMLCKSNCGFFGNAACEGYCSKCYKEHVKRQNTGSAAGRVTPTTSSSATLPSAVSLSTAAAALEAAIPSDIVMASLSNTGEHSSSSITIDTTALTSLPSSHQQTAPIAIPVQQPTSAQTTVNSNNFDDSTSTTPVATAGEATAVAANNNIMSMSCDASALIASSTHHHHQQTPSSSLLSTSAVSNTSSSGSMPAPGTSVDSAMSSGQKKRSRCSLDSCKRKVGLTGFDCRCGGLFCWEHRYSDKHDCQFDYKELGQDQIRKNNPIVVGEKIQKI